MKYEVTVPVKVVINAEDKEEAKNEASSYLYEMLTSGASMMEYDDEESECDVHMCEPSNIYEIINLKEISK